MSTYLFRSLQPSTQYQLPNRLFMVYGTLSLSGVIYCIFTVRKNLTLSHSVMELYLKAFRANLDVGVGLLDCRTGNSFLIYLGQCWVKLTLRGLHAASGSHFKPGVRYLLVILSEIFFIYPCYTTTPHHTTHHVRNKHHRFIHICSTPSDYSKFLGGKMYAYKYTYLV